MTCQSTHPAPELPLGGRDRRGGCGMFDAGVMRGRIRSPCIERPAVELMDAGERGVPHESDRQPASRCLHSRRPARDAFPGRPFVAPSTVRTSAAPGCASSANSSPSRSRSPRTPVRRPRTSPQLTAGGLVLVRSASGHTLMDSLASSLPCSELRSQLARSDATDGESNWRDVMRALIAGGGMAGLMTALGAAAVGRLHDDRRLRADAHAEHRGSGAEHPPERRTAVAVAGRRPRRRGRQGPARGSRRRQGGDPQRDADGLGGRLRSRGSRSTTTRRPATTPASTICTASTC